MEADKVISFVFLGIVTMTVHKHKHKCKEQKGP